MKNAKPDYIRNGHPNDDPAYDLGIYSQKSRPPTSLRLLLQSAEDTAIKVALVILAVVVLVFLPLVAIIETLRHH